MEPDNSTLTGDTAGRMSQSAIDRFWPLISEQLDLVPEMWQPWWTKEYLLNGALSGKIDFWAFGRGMLVEMVMMTQILDYPSGQRALSVLLVFGRGLDENLERIAATLEAFAKATKCDRVEITGRPGWARKLQRFGLRQTAVLLSAPVITTMVQ